MIRFTFLTTHLVHSVEDRVEVNRIDERKTDWKLRHCNGLTMKQWGSDSESSHGDEKQEMDLRTVYEVELARPLHWMKVESGTERWG